MGYQFYLINQFIDIEYLVWRRTWDTTEEEDYINGISA